MRMGFLFLLLCANLFAQDTTAATAAIVSAGYSAPSNFMKAAPGQVISLVVYGLDHRLDSPVVASGMPLPATLAGFSVSLQAGSTTLAAPLLGISQAPCVYPNAGAGLCQSLTIISMQAPLEIYRGARRRHARGCRSPGHSGRGVGDVRIRPGADQPTGHVRRSHAESAAPASPG